MKRRSQFLYRLPSIVDATGPSLAPQGRSWVRRLLVNLGLVDALVPDPRVRRDSRRIEVDENFCIEVFWKDVAAGRGPAMSVFVRGHELLRFDCFGRDRGHFHAALADPPGDSSRRIYFREVTSREQIERSLREVETNLRHYQQRSGIRSIRTLDFDVDDLRRALAEARASLLSSPGSIRGEERDGGVPDAAPRAREARLDCNHTD